MRIWIPLAVLVVLFGVILVLGELTLKYSTSDDPRLHEKSEFLLSILVILTSTMFCVFGCAITLQGRQTISEQTFPPSKFAVFVGGIKCEGGDASRLGWLLAASGATIVLLGLGLGALYTYSIWLQDASSL